MTSLNPDQSTAEVIAPIITSTYGDGGFVQDFIPYLAARIDAGDFDSRGREHAVMVMCWDWFTGGTTAANVAAKIEEALR